MEINCKPLYQPWNEDAFRADEGVMVMTAVQRWMYRTLLQSAFVCSSRPYLPKDPAQLWKLAGCENRKQWEANSEIVLDMFETTEIEGRQVIFRKRLLDDWNRLVIKREEIADKAKKAAETRWGQKIASVNAAFSRPSPIMLDECSSNALEQLAMPTDAKRSEVSEVKEREVKEENTTARIYKKPISLDQFCRTAKRVLGTCDDQRYCKDAYKSIIERFDSHVVFDKLEPWLVKNPGSRYPLKDFFRAVPGLILVETEAAAQHPDLDNLCAYVFELCEAAPAGKNRQKLNELLASTPEKELEVCFKECQAGNQDQEGKWLIREFCQGGAEAIILARKKRAEKQQNTQEYLDRELERLRQEGERESADFAAKESEEAKLAEESLEFFLTDGDAVEETVAGATTGPLDG